MRTVLVAAAAVALRACGGDAQVFNALHDSRGALGDATPCCASCDRALVGDACPASMPNQPETVVNWSEYVNTSPDEPVTIPCGLRVNLDVSPPPLPGLYVRGHLHVVDGIDIKLRSDFVYVCGVLSAGTQEKPHTSRFEVELTGTNTVEESGIDYGLKTFATFGGLTYLRSQACESKTWTRLAASVYPGDTMMTLQEPMAWPEGATLAVASTDWDAEQTEEVAIVSADGPVVRLDRPFRFAHSGRTPTSAEVALISRNIVVTTEAGCEYAEGKPLCGHFIISHTPHSFVCGVEFTKLGAHTTLGKYPLHAHQCGRAPDLVLRANSIHHNYHRSVVIHSTSDAEISRNIAYLTQGHMFVFENGLEMRNQVIDNVGMVTRAPNPPWSCDGYTCAGADQCGFGNLKDGTLEVCGSRDDGHAETFWIANPQNDFVGNVAVGGCRSGFSIYPMLAGPLIHNASEQRRVGLPDHLVRYVDSKNPHGKGFTLDETIKHFGPNSFEAAHYRLIDRTNTYQSTDARHLEFSPGGRFERNVAHSTRIAFHVYPQWTPRVTMTSLVSPDQSSTSASPYSRAGEQAVVWLNLTAYKVNGAAFRIKTRCSSWNCITIQGATVISAAMAVRARDVYSRFTIADMVTQPFAPTDDVALLSGGCLSTEYLEWNDTQTLYCNSTNRSFAPVDPSSFSLENSRRKFTIGSHPGTEFYEWGTASKVSKRWVHCAQCGDGMKASWPPKETNFDYHKRRLCRAPFYAINFDARTIAINRGEGCSLNEHSKHSEASRHRTSCYENQESTRVNLPSTVRVDKSTMKNFRAHGYHGDYHTGFTLDLLARKPQFWDHNDTVLLRSEEQERARNCEAETMAKLVLGSFHTDDDAKEGRVELEELLF